MEKTCEICYKIICRKCGWEASSDQVILIQQEILSSCPACLWSPKEDL